MSGLLCAACGKDMSWHDNTRSTRVKHSFETLRNKAALLVYVNNAVL